MEPTRYATIITLEHRTKGDRRQSFWQALCYGSWHGRRRNNRRLSTPTASYLDWYRPLLFLSAISLYIFSCMDAFITLFLIQQGATELNPVMRLVLHYNTTAFYWLKIVATAGGILILVLHKNTRIRKLPVESLIHGLAIIYALLISYEIGLADMALAML
jgi:hypothetical protein